MTEACGDTVKTVRVLMLVSPTDFQKKRKFGDEAEEMFDRADRGGVQANSSQLGFCHLQARASAVDVGVNGAETAA